jgi:hypothetical protein
VSFCPIDLPRFSFTLAFAYSLILDLLIWSAFDIRAINLPVYSFASGSNGESVLSGEGRWAFRGDCAPISLVQFVVTPAQKWFPPASPGRLDNVDVVVHFLKSIAAKIATSVKIIPIKSQ